MNAPFMQLYVGDYLKDTRHLTAEQHGAYLLLLMSMWAHGGDLPNDPKKLARLACCTASRWAKIGADVLEFFEVDGDVITQARLRLELKKALEKSIKRAEAGMRGGSAKPLKSKAPTEANASGLLKHSSEPEPEPEEGGVEGSADEALDDWPEGKAFDHARMLCEKANTVMLDAAREGGLAMTSGRLHAWRRDGARWERDVVPVVVAMAVGSKQPIKSWKYFDAAIARAKAENEREMEKVNVEQLGGAGRSASGASGAGGNGRGAGSMARVLAWERGHG